MKSIRTTNALENLNREFRRRTKTQASFSSEESAVALLFGLIASGQFNYARVPTRRASDFRHWCRGSSETATTKLPEAFVKGWQEILTLTVVKLALPALLRQSLATTNAIENLNGTLRRVSRNVKRWKSPSMVRRWTALGVVTAQKEFRRIKGYRHMGALVHALRSKQKSLDSDEFAA